MSTHLTVAAESAANATESLAQALLCCMDRDSAIRVCRVNAWQGVLDAILAADAPAPGGGNEATT